MFLRTSNSGGVLAQIHVFYNKSTKHTSPVLSPRFFEMATAQALWAQASKLPPAEHLRYLGGPGTQYPWSGLGLP